MKRSAMIALFMAATLIIGAGGVSAYEDIVTLPDELEDGYENFVTLPGEVDLECDENGYQDFVTLPGEVDLEDDENGYQGFVTLPGEIVVDSEILERAALPFLRTTDAGDVVMVPLRAIAEALGYEVNWNGYLRSVQLGAAIHLWIGDNEVHVGRMVPIELPVAPILVDGLTFVPLEFFTTVLGYTVDILEGQVVIEA